MPKYPRLYDLCPAFRAALDRHNLLVKAGSLDLAAKAWDEAVTAARAWRRSLSAPALPI